MTVVVGLFLIFLICCVGCGLDCVRIDRRHRREQRPRTMLNEAQAGWRQACKYDLPRDVWAELVDFWSRSR